MVKLRLKRFGRSKRAFYRVAAMDSRSQRDGRAIEELGWYDPMGEGEKRFHIDRDRVQYWLGTGAQPSDTVADLLRHAGFDLPARRPRQQKAAS